MSTKTAPPDFESSVARLEAIVAEMESGALTLSGSLERLEEAVRLSRVCNELLEEAEVQIKVLTESGETIADTSAFRDQPGDE